MASFTRSDLTGRSGMPQKSSARPGLISASAGGNPKVVMVQEAEPSEAPASIPKVSPNEQYDPSQQVLSVLVRHTYNTDPENLEGNLENQLSDRLRQTDASSVNGPFKCTGCGKDFVNKSRYKHHVKYPCEGPFKCTGCGKDFVNKSRYKHHVKYPCEGKYRCSSCGKQYSFKPCYERHLKYLCKVIKKAEPKDTVKDVPLLPRLRIRKPDQLKPENGLVEAVTAPVPDGVKDNSSEDEFSDSHSSNTETEASDSWDAEDKADDDDDDGGNGTTSTAPTSVQLVVRERGPFTCSTCGKLYMYKSWYDRHLWKGCGDQVGGVSSSSPLPSGVINLAEEVKGEAKELSLGKGCDGDSGRFPSGLGRHLDAPPEPSVASAGPGGLDPSLTVQQWVVDIIPTDQLVYCCSVPYCGQSFVDQGSLLHHQGEHSYSGPEYGGSQKRKGPKVPGDQAESGTLGGDTSSESREAHTDYLSMIQISNVMSLVTSPECRPMTEELATSTGKEREPEEGNPSSGSRGKDVSPRADKLRCHSRAQKCLRNRLHARQKLLISGGRRAVCLLCGRRFGSNAALDQHMAVAHCERLQYRCGSCNMSFRARTCLCRHVLQAHCDLKKMKCCICKRRYRAAHHLQRHVLKQHSSWHRP
ncbi:hypothetical protein SKAU_G00005500 [Synaphobranchus kaupii]|uniref:C2H2-type domain-containing protein n=1 Tax=Synaphobranchus kaupii TaxID=118154 RepID=A0A9Q1GAR8_SYNKA|nr:hypothetical protein SKAU_G00005500 [Synaphobranchus kaupii]